MSERASGEGHLQRLDVLKLVGVPLLDLPVLPRREEEVSLGDKLEGHDAAERERETGEVRAGGSGAPLGSYLSSCANMERWQSPKSKPQIFTFRSAEPVAMSVLSCSTQRGDQKHRCWLFCYIFSEEPKAPGNLDLIRFISVRLD